MEPTVMLIAIAMGIRTIVRVSNCDVIESSRLVWAYSHGADWESF